MRRALDLAAQGLGFTSPNPCVGAVIVKGGTVLGEGWHRAAGRPHAEIEALRDARRRGHDVTGATLYVTLEPCSTHGRTPPCCDAIVAAGLRRVVIGATDPNPRHAGRGQRILLKAGLRVVEGVLAAEASALNRAFNRWITTRRPWVIAKLAVSLDGRYSRPPGQPTAITGPRARRDGHGLRLRSDAILIGAETLRRDDPQLTVRGVPGAVRKPQPWRVVMSRSRDLPGSARLFTDEHRDRTRVATGTLKGTLKELGAEGVTCVLIEGGGRVVESALRDGLVDEIAFYIAPSVLGGAEPVFDYLAAAAPFQTGRHVTPIGRDQKIAGWRE